MGHVFKSVLRREEISSEVPSVQCYVAAGQAGIVRGKLHVIRTVGQQIGQMSKVTQSMSRVLQILCL